MVKEDLRKKIEKDIASISKLETFSENEKQDLIAGLLARTAKTETKKESKETSGNLPEFEDHTLYVKSTGRKETAMKLYDGGMTKVKVKENAKGEAEVLEYIDGHSKGEQLFVTYDIFVKYACAEKGCTREVLEKQYLPTEEKLTLLAGKQRENSEQYQNFYKNIQPKQCSGYFIPRGEKLGRVGECALIRLAGGDDAEFRKDGRKTTKGGKNYGFSGRLFK